MNKIVKVEPLDHFQLYLEYSDGFSGNLSFEKMLKHKDYKCIRDFTEFKKVSIDEKNYDVVWNCGATLCRNAARGMLELKEEIKNLGLSL